MSFFVCLQVHFVLARLVEMQAIVEIVDRGGAQDIRHLPCYAKIGNVQNTCSKPTEPITVHLIEALVSRTVGRHSKPKDRTRLRGFLCGWRTSNCYELIRHGKSRNVHSSETL